MNTTNRERDHIVWRFDAIGDKPYIWGRHYRWGLESDELARRVGERLARLYRCNVIVERAWSENPGITPARPRWARISKT